MCPLAAPYMDHSAAGYIVTLSRLVDPALGLVAAMDVSPRYLHRLLVDSIDKCAMDTMHCFMFQQNGYVVGHPDVGFRWLWCVNHGHRLWGFLGEY